MSPMACRCGSPWAATPRFQRYMKSCRCWGNFASWEGISGGVFFFYFRFFFFFGLLFNPRLWCYSRLLMRAILIAFQKFLPSSRTVNVLFKTIWVLSLQSPFSLYFLQSPLKYPYGQCWTQSLIWKSLELSGNEGRHFSRSKCVDGGGK